MFIVIFLAPLFFSPCTSEFTSKNKQTKAAHYSLFKDDCLFIRVTDEIITSQGQHAPLQMLLFGVIAHMCCAFPERRCSV